MAIDPRISLGVQPPQSVGSIFQNALTNIGLAQGLEQQRQQAPFQNQLLQLQTELAQAQQPAMLQQAQQAANPLSQVTGQQQQMLQLATISAQNLKPAFDSNSRVGVISGLTALRDQLATAGAPQAQVDAINADIAQANTLEGFEELKRENQQFLQQVSGQQASIRSFAPITDPETGQVSIPTFDPNTAQASLTTIEGARQLTPEQKQQQELATFKTKESEKTRLSRAKEIKKELGDRNRSAARSQQPLFEALRLASNERTAEGLAAGIKTQLARVLPGIDVANEGNLDSALNRLALEQLQNFKGPTTDFEFGVTQDITGRVSDPREANIARLKSLQRANWFAKREFKQFQEFSEAGKDPDDFSFDFNETVKTKKGEFSLRDIQDTAVDANLTIEEVLERLDQ